MASVNKRTWTHNGEKKSAYVVRYFDRGGVHRQRTFERKKDADRFRTQVEVEIGDGTHLARAEAKTVAQVTAEFMRQQEDRLRDGRIGRGYMNILRIETQVSILPRLGARRIDELTIADADAFYAAMIREDGLSPVTAKGRVATLRFICRFAVRRGYSKVESITHALADLRGTSENAVRTFTVDEMRYLLQALTVRRSHQRERNHLLLTCAVHLATFCGLRFGEIMGLTAANLDLSGRVVRIRHSLTEYDELKEPKTRSGVRDVGLPEHLAAMLAQWMQSYQRPDDRGLVFRTVSGKMIGGGNFHRLHWHPLLDIAGLYDKADPFHFHALRHFAASWMISSGIPLMETASLLGHRTFTTTLQTYAHPVVGGSKRAALMNDLATKLLSVPAIAHQPEATQH